MECPNCGSDYISDRWVAGRKLQRSCNDCGWKEKPRTPDRRVIKNTKFIKANQFQGFHYEVYDQYGHETTFSRSYGTAEEARVELLNELSKLNKHPNYAPCTGILWPDRVEVVGEVVREGDSDALS
jgi:hypothetical protein